jgi:hypothetical protein
MTKKNWSFPRRRESISDADGSPPSRGRHSVASERQTLFFWLFILLHTVFWTLGPWLTRNTLPHDTLESITWGMQWQWGYNKHPFLAAWLTAGISELFHAVEWPVYLLAQLAVAATMIATWQLARKILPAAHAIVAVLALDGVLYYNINSFNFTPDTLQSPLWSLLTLFFYQATKTQQIRYWLLTGMMIALSIMTKYQVAMLLLPMMLFCLVNKQARSGLFSIGPCLAIAVVLLLVSPHLFWLWQHDFITIRYALGAPYGLVQNNSPVFCLFHYLVNCLAYVSGVFLLFWPFYGKRTSHWTMTRFDEQFLFFAGFGPCFLTALFCLLNGDNIPARWSTPYFFLTGILLMAWLRPDVSKQQFKQFAITLVILSSLLWSVRMGTIMSHSNVRSDAYLPNKAIAAKLERIWHQHYATPLSYVGGAHYLVGTTIPYITNRPTAYFSWDPEENPWLDEEDLAKHGGVFVWDVGLNYFWDGYSLKLNTLPKEIKQRFPNLIILGTYTFYRSTPEATPVTIGVALLPPAGILS